MSKPDTSWDSNRMPLYYFFIYLKNVLPHYCFCVGGFRKSNVNMKHPGRFSGVIGFLNVWITPQTPPALRGLQQLIAALELSDRLAKWGAPVSACLWEPLLRCTLSRLVQHCTGEWGGLLGLQHVVVWAHSCPPMDPLLCTTLMFSLSLIPCIY